LGVWFGCSLVYIIVINLTGVAAYDGGWRSGNNLGVFF